MDKLQSKMIWLVVLAVIAISAGGFLFSQRSSDQLIRISSNPWVGFTPFIYAQEKGWLEKTPFRFTWVVDLSENSRLYQRGFTQGFTATQYEMFHFSDYSHFRPMFLIDRSAGADSVLSNRSLEQLRKSKETINVYLEMGSLNEDFFQAFVAENNLGKLKFKLSDTSQKEVTRLSAKGDPLIVISYSPYATELIKNGFVMVSSTAELQSFFVIDALFVDERSISASADEFRQLKAVFDKAVDAMRSRPQEFYNVVRGYLEGQSYEEFIESTQQVEWLNQGDTSRYQRELNSHNVKTDRLIL
jgi:NitT/TauT family transport system substrate-binding protein